MTPQPYQRTRRKGATTPPGTVYVGRGSEWGNPYRVTRRGGRWLVEIVHPDGGTLVVSHHANAEDALTASLLMYAMYAEVCLSVDPTWLDPLRGAAFLSCWCRLGEKCHRDTLIAMLKG